MGLVLNTSHTEVGERAFKGLGFYTFNYRILFYPKKDEIKGCRRLRKQDALQRGAEGKSVLRLGRFLSGDGAELNLWHPFQKNERQVLSLVLGGETKS